jgi:hypothetical protein
MELCLTNFRKEVIWASLTIWQVTDSEGDIVAYDGIIYDVSENKIISTLLHDVSDRFGDLE